MLEQRWRTRGRAHGDGQSSNLGRRFSSRGRERRKGEGWWCGEKQLKLHRGGRWWRFLYRKREERGRVGSEARVRREQKPVGGRRWARRKMLEPICSPLSRLLLSFRPPPFVPSFFGQRRNLCYLLVTFIWSPRVLDLSRYSLSLSLFPPPFSFHPPPPLSAYYHLPTARSLEQPGTSYSGF